MAQMELQPVTLTPLTRLGQCNGAGSQARRRAAKRLGFGCVTWQRCFRVGTRQPPTPPGGWAALRPQREARGRDTLSPRPCAVRKDAAAQALPRAPPPSKAWAPSRVPGQPPASRPSPGTPSSAHPGGPSVQRGRLLPKGWPVLGQRSQGSLSTAERQLRAPRGAAGGAGLPPTQPPLLRKPCMERPGRQQGLRIPVLPTPGTTQGSRLPG